jgi:hypothetical protein
MEIRGNTFILPIKIQQVGFYYLQTKLKLQIILTTPNALVTIHYPKIQMPNKSQKLKKDRY